MSALTQEIEDGIVRLCDGNPVATGQVVAPRTCCPDCTDAAPITSLSDPRMGRWWERDTPGLMEGIRARREARRVRDVSLGELLWAGTGLLLLALTAVSLR